MPDPDPSDNPDSPRNARRLRVRPPRFGLSLTQLVATGLAATTATFAASFLGVAGTVVGAALFSVLMAVGNAVYGQSLKSGRERVRDAVPVLAARTGVDPAAPTIVAVEPAAPPGTPPELPTATPFSAKVWKRVALGAVSVFVVVLAVVTGVEVVAGRPVSDVLRGDSGHGTSFFGADTVITRTVTPATPATTPTMTVTVTPKVVVTTPTVTQTAPTTTQTVPPPTSTSSGTSPAPRTSTTSSGTPSPSTSPSAR